MVFKLPFSDGPEPGYDNFGHRYAGLRSVIVMALANADDIDARDIEVSVVGGTVILEGSVPTPRDMERAMEVTIAVAGVEVHNRLWRSRH